jgi:hypothetical protein
MKSAMKRNWIRALLRVFSLTSAMFIFQACYGTPQDFGLDLFIEGQVKAKTSGLPIKGIKVSVTNNAQYGYTDNEGRFSLYTARENQLIISFEDIDLAENGKFMKKDTILTNIPDRVTLNISLEEN